MTPALIAARRAYQAAQVCAYVVYTTGGSPRLVEASLLRLDAARWALLAAESGR